MAIKKDLDKQAVDTNPDPLTGEHGSHPVGTGLGAAVGGAAAGAAAGAIAGPIGTVAGAVVGGVAGAFAGKSIAERIDPTVESAYWAENYRNRPYYQDDVGYDAYHPAYRFGWESRARYPDQNWNEVEDQLQVDWESYRTAEASDLDWDRAQLASKDAWRRVDQVYADTPPVHKPR